MREYMRRLITICREFGSGGREIGKRVAEELQIPYYDDEIVTQLAERTKLAVSYVNQFSERKVHPIQYFPITTGRSFHQYHDPKLQQSIQLRIEQTKLLKELAETYDCVIVGRCANYVLQEFNPLRIFVYADMNAKILRCREKAVTDEKTSDREMKKLIQGINKERAAYYQSVTGNDWGLKQDYDLLINTTDYSVKQAAHMIARIFNEYS